MSLLPLLLDYEDPFDLFERSCRPSSSFAITLLPRDLHRLKQAQQQKLKRTPYRRQWNLDKAAKEEGSLMGHRGKNEFQVSMDVEHFAPNEISVKTVDNAIVVEGKHEEKEDDHGFISRHFLRRYQLPEEYDVQEVSSTLSSDGVLTIKAPKVQKAIEGKERVIQIQHTGPAASCIKAADGGAKDGEEVMEAESSK